MSMTEVVHVIVKGSVQGVGYRYFVEKVALRLGVAGWVRNLPGGEVEVLARLPEGSKGKFLAALQQGPAMARVGAVEFRAAGGENECPQSGFRVRF